QKQAFLQRQHHYCYYQLNLRVDAEQAVLSWHQVLEALIEPRNDQINHEWKHMFPQVFRGNC
ncbi:MAG TPA: hypothetical protein V6C90_13975, partial [Coleofasciculaceae cyanobacterium]